MDIVIIVALGCIGLAFGMIAVTFITCGADKKHKIGGALITIAIGALIFSGIVCDAKMNEETRAGEGNTLTASKFLL